jgi:hypothetical protein
MKIIKGWTKPREYGEPWWLYKTKKDALKDGVWGTKEIKKIEIRILD